MYKQRVTMADVAELAQVSKMSVSRVLNNKPGVAEETRQRIIEAADHLGYVAIPQTATHTGMDKVVALLLPDIATIYMGEILRGISNAAEKLDCGLMLYRQSLVEDNINISLFNTNIIDGVVTVVPRNHEGIVADLNTHKLPYVIIDHRSQIPNEASVTATNRKGMLDATRYLLALGHRRIGFITGRMDIVCSHDRLQGYRDGLEEVGVPYHPELVQAGNFQQPSGFSATQKLLQLENPPTAIIASNDLMAFGVMEAVRNVGLGIGDDVSIIGFDDVFLASQTYPPLTTVRQPLAEMGETALDMLIALIEERPTLALQRELPTELIVRESTARFIHKTN